MPCVCSPGSNQTGAMLKCTAQVIWPSGAAYAGAAASAGARASAATARRPATRRFMAVSLPTESGLKRDASGVDGLSGIIRPPLRAEVAAADRDHNVLFSLSKIGHQSARSVFRELDLRDQLPARLVEHLKRGVVADDPRHRHPRPVARRLRASSGAPLRDEEQRPRRQREAPALPSEPPA